MTLRVLVGLILALHVLTACIPKKPSVTPQAVQVTGVGLAGVSLRTDLSAYNPNRFNLTVQAVSGRIVLNDAVPLGNATTPTSVLLPSQGWQRFFVDLELPWLNLPAAIAIAQLQQQVPYTFEGDVTIGGKIRITVPLRMQGSVPARELLRAGSGMPTFPVPSLSDLQRRGTLFVVASSGSVASSSALLGERLDPHSIARP